jgi:hypothetical protein
MHGVSRRALTRIVVLVGALLIALPGHGLAQRRGGDGPPPRLRGEGVSPAEIQRLFDAYVVMQAQEAVGVSEEQYPRFLTRLKALQDVRRRGQIERARILLELRRLARGADASADETAIRAQLKALDDTDARTSGEEKMALEALDQVMDTTQQARFRLFEEQMERRKVELMMRARQSAIRPRDRF